MYRRAELEHLLGYLQYIKGPIVKGRKEKGKIKDRKEVIIRLEERVEGAREKDSISEKCIGEFMYFERVAGIRENKIIKL
jgi:hypothetical protein